MPILRRAPCILAVCILAVCVSGRPIAVQAGSLTGNLAAARELPDVVQPLLATVVNISVLKPPGTDPAAPKNEIVPDRAFGSGFVIAPEGFIVTNKHVVEHGYAVTVAFSDGTSFPAEIVATNQRPDLALLKIAAGKPLPYVKFGDSDALRVGEPVIAIGNPLGLSSSLSVGVVSALNRDVNMTMIDDFIQTDAAINHGNSGGPLFNLQGEVIGVNWAIIAPGQQTGSAGLGFAIPSNDAAWVVAEMRHFGRLHAGFIGVRLQQIMPDVELAMGLPTRSGGIVSGVIPNTPAAAAGLEEGDVITAYNGREPRDVRALLRSLSASAPGSTIALQLWRNGVTKTVDVKVAPWPNNLFDPAGQQTQTHEAPRQASPDFGLTLASADPAALEKSPFAKGEPAVAITKVASNTPAADLRLASGNLILRVGTDRVATPDDVRQRLEKARAEGRKSIVMLVEASDGPHWIVLPLAAP